MPRIRFVRVYKYDIPMEPFTISLGTIHAAHNILIEVGLDNGLSGWGEGSPFPMLVGETQNTGYTLARDFATLWLGKNPLEHERRMQELNRYMAFHPTLKSAFDMALYDLRAQMAGLPLYQYLGGTARVMLTDETIGLSTPENMVKKALQLQEKNAPAIKVKLGTNVADDTKRIRMIREAIGPETPLRVDANQGWDVISAIGVLQNIAPYYVEYCEEPVPRWNNAGLKAVRDASPIPIMADESVFDHHDAQRITAMGACDYINIKLAKSGGLWVADKINGIAEAAGIRCMMGSMCESRLGLTASAHFAAARTNIFYCDLDMVFTMKADPVEGGMVYKGHEIHLPDTPGLGATVDPRFLKDLEFYEVA